ncbi:MULTISPECIES: agmatine/peptidylarginine deiminase [unclassified Curtobacterium]|uniref:agmatine deiminase family protein n=1 Tax=unclassified Curtobacterium TaxID=257496 RepID=UPI000F47F208|nr:MULTISPECIES: agmatine deiminase family protein [unclassified Curtobacterium]ROQ16556.1 agmatine deiminase [Curtobacterium sp. PhB171]ROQ25368.1 agmatine deiminase [Curtobacterium sp. PhB170]ROS36820.1 agmatine deiminase [Curtobacterium sp. PhB131]ROS71496.1 agmatine deiminase [Curtobacterium sp. PhB141]
MTWVMPPETAPQERSWMAFPRPGLTLGDDAASAEAARRTWATTANTISEHQPVTIVVDPVARADARRLLSTAVEVLEAPLDDFWMRDIGPTFVVDDVTGELGAVDWVFNGWGANSWSTWTRDAEVAATVAAAAGAHRIPSLLVNEGGAIHVDGTGTVLVTETVQLDPRRNPYADRERVELELARTIGATDVVWLPRGLTRDYDGFGTRGHVDMVATFAGAPSGTSDTSATSATTASRTVLLHAQPDAGHPDHLVMPQIRRALEQATDATIVELPAPLTLTDDDGPVDWNYVNHVVVNGAVIACAFGDAVADDRARGILADVYPGRQVRSIDARQVFARGGGLHCITQQQPAV